LGYFRCSLHEFHPQVNKHIDYTLILFAVQNRCFLFRQSAQQANEYFYVLNTVKQSL
jgi:hypothetical protein